MTNWQSDWLLGSMPTLLLLLPLFAAAIHDAALSVHATATDSCTADTRERRNHVDSDERTESTEPAQCPLSYEERACDRLPLLD